MTKNAIAWIREDFKSLIIQLFHICQNHENVIALYIYNKTDFDKKEKHKNGGCLNL